MITHLNYIEDKELRDSLYKTLEKVFNVGNRYIAVDPKQIQFCLSRIYSFKNIPTFDKKAKGYFGVNPHNIDMKFITIFNNHEAEIYDIEKILENWKEDQQEYLTDEKIKEIENKAKAQTTNKILSSLKLYTNSVFKYVDKDEFFRINEEADIEEYVNEEWQKSELYNIADIIDDMYDDDYPVFKYNVDREFEDFIKNGKEKTYLSSKIKHVIRSIIETNYNFIKVHPHENKISIHKSIDYIPYFIYTDKEVIKWFLGFIQKDSVDPLNKILYINRLKTFWEECNNE